MPRKLIVSIIVSLILIPPTLAQDNSKMCGTPPSEQVKKEISSKTMGDIQGKAQAISKVLGSADIGGKIESERRTLYQTTDASERVLADRYLFYVTCLMLVNDKTMPLDKKLEAIRLLRSPLPTGGSKNESLKTLLASMESTTTLDSIREALGAPKSRSKVSIDLGKFKRSYVTEKYTTPNADIVVVGSAPIRALAIKLNIDTPTKGQVPLPHYSYKDVGLGDYTLADLKDNCSGSASVLDGKFFFAITPTCYFGRSGGYNYFVFGFSASRAWEKCSGDLFDIDNQPFEKIKCKAFWNERPNFAMVSFPGENEPASVKPEAIAAHLASDLMHTLYRPF